MASQYLQFTFQKEKAETMEMCLLGWPWKIVIDATSNSSSCTLWNRSHIVDIQRIFWNVYPRFGWDGFKTGLAFCHVALWVFGVQLPFNSSFPSHSTGFLSNNFHHCSSPEDRVTPSGWTSCRLASSSWAALATPQIDRPLNCSSLPSVTHHKKQEATTELHSQFSFLSSPVNSPSSPPSPLPPFSHAQKTPTFGSRLTFTVYCS